jgi:ABC-type polysaccharide/polyol phosphate transport system ATPase subunit
MANDIAISVEGLGKSYMVGHQSSRERYTALRDVLARSARNIARKTRDMFSDRAIVQGDEIEEFWALKDVGFDVHRGDVMGVIGRNGAGKSTLLKVLSRITEPTEGRIRVAGRVVSLLEVGTGFHPELTGRENIYLNGAILGMKRAEIRAKFDEIVAFAEVERFLDTPVKRYSSGMYVRLAFAVAAHLEPEILVIDEVLAVGDAEFQKKCLGKMKDVAGHGRTVLFVSHNMAAVRALCARALLLVKGRLAMAGDAATVISGYAGQHTEAPTFSRAPLAVNKPHVIGATILGIEESGTHGARHVKIAVTVHSPRAMDVEVSATIRDYMGAPVGYAPVGALMSQSPAKLIPGANGFILAIDIARLALGHYGITLQVSAPFAEIFDTCEECLSLDIASEHFSDVIHPFRQDWQVGSVLFPSTIERARP